MIHTDKNQNAVKTKIITIINLVGFDSLLKKRNNCLINSENQSEFELILLPIILVFANI
ncbi:MAG: hypothetical protein ACYDEC_03415 [Bacteroidia bacterium]